VKVFKNLASRNTYSEREGDPVNDIKPGTKFEDLPETYLKNMENPTEQTDKNFYTDNPHLSHGKSGWVEIKNRYLCVACGYIFDEIEGDKDHGIAPNTSFEELSESYSCPVCAAGKDSFVLISDIET
jgi:rubredoxin